MKHSSNDFVRIHTSNLIKIKLSLFEKLILLLYFNQNEAISSFASLDDFNL